MPIVILSRKDFKSVELDRTSLSVLFVLLSIEIGVVVYAVYFITSLPTGTVQWPIGLFALVFTTAVVIGTVGASAVVVVFLRFSLSLRAAMWCGLILIAALSFHPLCRAIIAWTMRRYGVTFDNR